MIRIGTADFRAFSRSLGKAMPELRVDMNKQLRIAGQLVAAEAKSNVAPYSKSTKIKVSTARGNVAVVASGGPITSLLEKGNKGSSGGTSFRHPVFGTATWVDQPMHPYLYRALEDKREEAMALIDEAVETAFRRAGELL